MSRFPSTIADAPPTETVGLFPPTKWTVVLIAQGEGPEARQALDELCSDYREPLVVFARSRYGVNEAEDLVQGCLANVIAKKSYVSAERTQGRLRTFLLTMLIRHARDQWKLRTAEKRGFGKDTVPLDEVDEMPDELLRGPDSEYDRAWAVTVLVRGMERLKQEWRSRDKAREFTILQDYLGPPERRGAGYQIGARRLGVTPPTFRSRLHEFRKDYQQAVRAEIGETLASTGAARPSPEAVDEEFRALIAALRGPMMR